MNSFHKGVAAGILGMIIITPMVSMYRVYNEKKVEPPIIPLFSCYEIHGTKCSVTSNKENPCSYKVLVCKTPTGEVVYRSEKYHE